MAGTPFSSVFEVGVNVDLNKAFSNGLSVKSDSVAMTFVTDGSCFLFTVLFSFSFFFPLSYCNTNASSTTTKKSIYEEKSPVERILAEGFVEMKYS